MQDATPTEREAVMLRWRADHPEAAADAGPTDEEAAAILQAIRERAMQIENASLGLLMKNLRVNPRGNNTPSLRPFFFVVSIIVGGGILVAIANYVFSR